MQDILDRLEAELATAPDATFDLDSTIATGRRAVRRRRLAAGTAALAIAVAVGGATWAVAPGGDGPSRGQAAVDPSTSPTPTPTPTPTVDAGPEWGPDEVLRIDGVGRVSLNPAAEVLERRAFREGGEAYHVALGDEEYYALASVDDSISTQRLPAQGMGLVEWANAQSVLGSGDDSGAFGADGADGADGAGWVTIDTSSRLSATRGVRIVEQRPDPGLGDSFAVPGEPTAVAEVVVDQTTYFLVVRALDGGTTDVIPYRKDATITTLDAFVGFARERYAPNESGGSEGLR